MSHIILDSASEIAVYRCMTADDLDSVIAIENEIYPHPWTRGNFGDSLNAGYQCWIMDLGGAMVGYAVVMIGAGEAHLLNLSIAIPWQRRGFGRMLLEHFVNIARDSDAAQMFLEVRPSNMAARRLYGAFGFRQITFRRGYYPSGRGREDALLMGISL